MEMENKIINLTESAHMAFVSMPIQKAAVTFCNDVITHSVHYKLAFQFFIIHIKGLLSYLQPWRIKLIGGFLWEWWHHSISISSLQMTWGIKCLPKADLISDMLYNNSFDRETLFTTQWLTYGSVPIILRRVLNTVHYTPSYCKDWACDIF